MLLTLLFTSIISNAAVDKSQSEILRETGISEQILLQETEKSLSEYLYFEDAGVSCGMEDFAIQAFTASANASEAYSSFTVTSKVMAPVGESCGTYGHSLCYTTWTQRTGAWSVLGTECDESTVRDE